MPAGLVVADAHAAQVGRAVRDGARRSAPRVATALHYRLARQLRRTLITLDRDYLDDRKFPARPRAAACSCSCAPNENGLHPLLKRLDREVLRAPRAGPNTRTHRCHSRVASCTCTSTGGRTATPQGDRAGGRRSGPARSHRHRRLAASSTAGRIAAIEPAARGPGRRADHRRQPTVTSCPASSTCTCTASRGIDALDDAGDAVARSPRALAALRRHRVLSRRRWPAIRRPCAASRGRCARARAAPRPGRRACCRRTSKATSSTPSTRRAAASNACACRPVPTAVRADERGAEPAFSGREILDDDCRGAA